MRDRGERLNHVARVLRLNRSTLYRHLRGTTLPLSAASAIRGAAYSLTKKDL